MATLEVVEYGKENGQLVAIEVYSDGSTRKVQIKEGIVNYILNGVNTQSVSSNSNKIKQTTKIKNGIKNNN